MTDARILVVATLDTKGEEAAFLCERIAARGGEAVLVDAGILGEPNGGEPDVTREEVALAAGRTIEDVRDLGARGPAIECMMLGLAKLVPELHADHAYAGAVGLGGFEGALLAASALRTLPFGIPKVVVSPVASGVRRFGPFVGNGDLAMLHSVVDLQGLNAFTTRVLDIAAGMVTMRSGLLEWSEPAAGRVAISLNGNTTVVGTNIQRTLKQAGFEVVAFHSNGVGGMNMEKLAAEGNFAAVIDLTTNELVEEVLEGLFPVSDRLRTAGRASVPRVVVPGCLDFVCQGPPAEIEPRFTGRPVDAHNPGTSLVQVSEGEAERVAEAFIERLEDSEGPVRVVVPTRGLSLAGSPGGAFSGTRADGAVVRSLLAAAASRLPLILVDAPINASETARAILAAFREVLAVDVVPAPAAGGS